MSYQPPPSPELLRLEGRVPAHVNAGEGHRALAAAVEGGEQFAGVPRG